MGKSINLQDMFLNQVRKEGIVVTIFLTGGHQLKGTVKLHAIHLAPEYQTAAKANLSAQSAELRRLDTEYAQLLASCTTPGHQ